MTEKPTVVAALAAVMADVRAVAKKQKHDSPQAKFMFRGVDAVVNAVGPSLRDHGVVVVPVETVATHRDVQTSTGKASRESTVTVTYRFYGPAGDWLDAQVPGESMDSGDKGTAKAMSVAYRIVLLQALCLPTDEPDPDSQSYERAKPEPVKLDPLLSLKQEVWSLARRMEWDKAAMAQDYADRYGAVLGEATGEQLTAYRDALAAIVNGVPA